MATIKIKKTEFKKLYDLACDGWKTKFNTMLNKFVFSDEVEFEQNFMEEMKNACNPKQLKVFESIFKDHLPKNLFHINTYSKVCKELGVKELKLADFSFLDLAFRKKALAQAKIQQLEKLFNGSWIKDWNNRNQRKHYPYFVYNGKSWSVGVCGFVCGYSYAAVGFYLDERTARFVGETFIDMYQDTF
jgi:hypothetical protein